MLKLDFSKMHGQGNDFVMLNGVDGDLKELSAAQAIWLADRNEGIGADQVLLLTRGASGEFGYRIWNADGGEVAQCGNGARSAHAYLRRLGHVEGAVTLRTQAGTIEVGDGENGSRAYLAVPEFDPALISLARETTQDRYQLEWDGESLDFASVGLGNPHALFWVDDVACAPVAKLGQWLNEASDFPQGVNVGFATRPTEQGECSLRVFERGVGETKACGSGAVACAVVACREFGKKRLVIGVPGGTLLAGWDGDGKKAWVEGQVEHVFDGQVDLPVV